MTPEDPIKDPSLAREIGKIALTMAKITGGLVAAPALLFLALWPLRNHPIAFEVAFSAVMLAGMTVFYG